MLKQLKVFFIVIWAILAVVSIACASTSEKRVLVVITDTPSNVVMYNENNGSYIVSDLASAGYPFDVVTYSRFINMSLGNHDVIVLCGHTSPTPVSSVANKCQSAVLEGRKVFIYTDFPFQRYDQTGKRVEEMKYTSILFNAACPAIKNFNTTLSMPSWLQKDPSISAYAIPNLAVSTYAFTSQPPVAITTGGFTTGFLLPQGGTISSRNGSLLQNNFDYGKVISYLRYQDDRIVGFANDRKDGCPIVSFEVHCDASSDTIAIDDLDSTTQQYQLPLICLIVYNHLTPASIAKWNAVASPYITFGSHSYSHPSDWPSIPDVMAETSNAIALQKQIIPATKPYLNFSGSMNPTAQQMDQLYNAGVLFGGAGYDLRSCVTQNNGSCNVQRMPTNRTWLENLSYCNQTPYCLAHTVNSDYACWSSKTNFLTSFQTDFGKNLKYGLYSFTCIHDYMFDPATNYYYNGIHMSKWIKSVFDYLKQRSISYLAADELIAKLHDFQQGWIDHDVLSDGSLNITVHRAAAHANDIKIERKNGMVPVASGTSVLSQHLTDQFLYVSLQPEVESNAHVDFVQPSNLQVSFIPKPNNCTISWTTPASSSYRTVVVRYHKSYFPSNPNDGVAFGSVQASAGSRQQVSAPIDWQNSDNLYFSIFLCKDDGTYDIPAGALMVTSDKTPPSAPQIVLSSASGGQLSGQWTSTDSDSGIDCYYYAIGTVSGGNDVQDWTEIDSTSIVIPPLPSGSAHFLSIKAENNFGFISDITSCPITETIPYAESSQDGAYVIITGLVSAIFNDGYYVEQSTRVRGIKVLDNPSNLCEGDRVVVSGTLATINGERVVQPSK